MIDYIENYYNTAIENYCLEQYKDKTVLNALIKAISEQSQDVENSLQDLLYNRWLKNASGYQLDKLGEILGVERDYKSDESYKKALYIQILINRGNGTPEELMATLYNIYDNIYALLYKEIAPANIQITIFIKDILKPLQNINTIVKSIISPGIKCTLICAEMKSALILSGVTQSKQNFAIDNENFLYLDNTENYILSVQTQSKIIFKRSKGLSGLIVKRENILINEENYMINETDKLAIIEKADIVESVIKGATLGWVITNA